jgi:CBS domain containing-hemolysin-like protein
MPPAVPSLAEHILALVGALLALGLRSLIIAGEAGLSAVGAERASVLKEQSRSGRALARLKADPEATAGGIRVALGLCFALGVIIISRETVALRHTVFAEVPVVVLVIAGGAIVWIATVLADAIPRSLAAAHPEAWALRTAPVLLAFKTILAPLTRAAGLVVDGLVRPIGARLRFSLPPPPLDEIERILTQSRDVNAPEPALVRSLFDFGQRTAKDTMVPRTNVVAIAEDADPREVVQLLLEEGHTRIPVYRGTLDTIVGIIHVKDLLPLIANPELIILEDLLRPPLFVPWNRPIVKVMRELQRKRQHFAVVVDEYGGVAGIITLADIVAQIVGDIRDEFDTEVQDVVPTPDGGALVKADIRVGEFNEVFGTQIPEDAGYETLGGFVSFLAGAIPSEGDRFYHGGFELQVSRRDARRVLELRVTRVRAPAPTRAAETPA